MITRASFPLRLYSILEADSLNADTNESLVEAFIPSHSFFFFLAAKRDEDSQVADSLALNSRFRRSQRHQRQII